MVPLPWLIYNKVDFQLFCEFFFPEELFGISRRSKDFWEFSNVGERSREVKALLEGLAGNDESLTKGLEQSPLSFI